MLWERLAQPEPPAGFFSQTAVLAPVSVNGTSFLAAVGGSSGAGDLPRGREFDELVAAEGEAPLDLWLAPLDAVDTAGRGTLAWRPFRKRVLAFPPKPRCGFTLTALDGHGSRFLLFGGRSGRRGTVGCCLSDLGVLELSAGAGTALGAVAGPGATAETPAASSSGPRQRSRSASSSSGGEAEEIFFAEDYRASLAQQASGPAAAATVVPAAPSAPRRRTAGPNLAAAARGGRWGRGAMDDEDDGPDEEESGELTARDRDERLFRRPAGGPQTYTEVLSQFGANHSIAMTRRSPRPPQEARREDQDEDELGGGSGGPRWRFIQVVDGAPPRARAGHSAVLRPSERGGEEVAVLVYGGLTDGGLPLGDTYEARLSLGAGSERAIECRWVLADAGGSLNCEIAPWAHQEKPRPRARHSAVFWLGGGGRRGCMVVFGGLGLGCEGEPRAYGDTWTFVLGPGPAGELGGWRRPLLQGDAPSRRWGHGACLVGDGPSVASMLLCGGVGAGGAALADCWLLDLQDMRWEAVETVATHPLLGRSSLLRGHSASEGTPEAPAELGRCSAFWSASHDLAVVWGGSGPWAWHEPERLRSRRLDRVARGAQTSSPVRCEVVPLPTLGGRRGEASPAPGLARSAPLPSRGGAAAAEAVLGDEDLEESDEAAASPERASSRHGRRGSRRRQKKHAAGGAPPQTLMVQPRLSLGTMELEVQDAWSLEFPTKLAQQLEVRPPRLPGRGHAPERPAPAPGCGAGTAIAAASKELPEVQLRGAAPRVPSQYCWAGSGAERASPSADLPGVLPPPRRRPPPANLGGAAGPDADFGGGGGWAPASAAGPRAKLRPGALADPSCGFLAGRLRGEVPSLQSWPPLELQASRRLASRLDLGPLSRPATPNRS